MPKNEPKVSAPVGPPPEHFDKIQCQIWERKAAVGYWLTEAHRGLLEVNVTAYALMLRCYPEISKALIFQGPNGGPIQNPYLPIFNKQREIAMKSDAELGFTPVSSSKVVAPKKEDESPFADWEVIPGGRG